MSDSSEEKHDATVLGKRDRNGTKHASASDSVEPVAKKSATEEESDDEDEAVGETRDDERSGTRYNVSCRFQ